MTGHGDGLADSKNLDRTHGPASTAGLASGLGHLAGCVPPFSCRYVNLFAPVAGPSDGIWGLHTQKSGSRTATSYQKVLTDAQWFG